MQRLLVIAGPTASGKSELALKAARLFDGEIISADSVQVYRELDIGSAKPNAAVLNAISHHLISTKDLTQDFNAGIFRSAALSAIEEIKNRNHKPVIVGGTGLYIKSLLQGLIEIPDIPEETNNQVETICAQIRSESSSEMEVSQKFHIWLQSLDPKAASSLNANDLARMKRAAVVWLTTGRSLFDIISERKWGNSSLSALVIVLCPYRDALYSSIDKRVEHMIDLGLVEETEGILHRNQLKNLLSSSGVGALPKSLNSIGYRHACMYLNKELGFDEMVELLKRDTRHFAKRQLTWWRNEPRKLGWMPVEIQKGAQQNALLYEQGLYEQGLYEQGLYEQGLEKQGLKEAGTLETINECLEWSEKFLNSARACDILETKGQSETQFLIVGSGLKKL